MRYFAYGADMRREALGEALGHPVEGVRATLRGFRLAFTARVSEWQGGVADLEADEGGEVEGVLFELSVADDMRLRVLEGLTESAHRARRVRVEAEDGRDLDAVAFVVKAREGRVRPSQTYLDAMVEGATQAGLSAAYIEYLMALYPDERPVGGHGPGEEE